MNRYAWSAVGVVVLHVVVLALVVLFMSVPTLPAQPEKDVMVLDGVIYDQTRYMGFFTLPNVFICSQDSTGKWSADPLPTNTLVLIPHDIRRY